MPRPFFRLFPLLLSFVLLCACSADMALTEAVSGFDLSFSKEDIIDSYDEAEAVHIVFDGEGAHYAHDGSEVELHIGTSKSLILDTPGVYVLSGVWEDGRVMVNAEDGLTHIVLAGVNLSCSNSAPLYAANGDLRITLAPGTENRLTDGQRYDYPEPGVEEPNACIYGDDDLCINGSGSLTVLARFNNGIGSKDRLHILGGSISVSAPNNALKGNDCVLIGGGTLSLSSEEDGIKADNDAEADQGYIGILGGEVSIGAGDDALQAAHAVVVRDAKLHMVYGGKDVNCDGVVVGVGE